MRSSNKFILLILSTITLISLVTESRKTIPSQEKKRELEKLLNHINKPAIKSFQSKHGYILDCIDIHKQLAFDHPLLKNHSVQLKPTTIPKWTRDNNTSQKSTSLPFRQEEDIICPPGTVIIKRTTLEDLIQFQRLESLGLKPTSKDRNDDPPGHYTAVAQYYALNFGGKGNINVWDPQVEPDQYSLSSLYVQGGRREDFETISAGWIVSPKLNHNHSSLFLAWSANKKGCYNTLCPGFVQVSRKFPLGSVARPVSKYGGKQYHLEISIYQERLTRDWWYVLKGEPVGYWPNPLFSYNGLAEGADNVWWGGEVFSADKNRISPIMGSGFVPQDDFGKAAYINGLRVIDRYSRKVMMPPAKDLVVYASSPTCYNVKTISRRGEYWSRAIFYGGPAGCTTEHDEIFDCIDIHKQLAFDHHLLKNHTVQMKPTSVPKWNTSNNNSQKVDPLQLLPRGISCPDGTFATVDYEYSTVSGVKGNINLWDLQVSQDQVSLATMAIAGGPIENLASISVGWMVNPLLYQDHIHLYTYWTADGYKKTGCYDIRCPGFVQVSKRIPLGVLKPVSIYDGTQYQMELSLHQDHATGDWWFIFGGVNVGYWPKSLFIASGLAKGTDKTSRGGQVYSPLTKKSPFVGSGHFPNEGMGKAAFINGIEIIDGKGETLIPQIYTIKTHESSPNCYKAKFIHDDDDPWIRAVFYGGPGGCTGQLSSEESEAVALIVVAKSDRTMPVEMEENELVSLLNSINKPAVTSFQTEHGDILDCIDINKQLAFDHPLLKNHTIQLRPRNIPKWTVNNSTSKNGGSMPFRQDDISCPFGTVVVKRTTHEDLILSQRLKSTGSKYLTYVTSKDKNIDLTGFHFAMAEYGHNNYGAKVNLSIWEPKVSPTQFSSASMLIGGGSKEQFQSIRAGWIVYQWLNRNHSRLYTYWTADGFTKTGCYNTLCPGFVQVSKRVPLGILLEPVSVYDGHQSEVGIVIYKDVVTGNWWLFVHDEMVGYWPNSLFTKSGLGHGAGLVSYGGEVYSPVNEKSPGMGSGHFPAEGYTKAAYVNGFEVVCNNDSIFSEPSFPVMMFANTPKCYRVMPGRGQLRVWFDSLFYGGPGGCV
ncbi:unnamed protein product [Brassica oleracea]